MTYTCRKTADGGQDLRWTDGPIPAGRIRFAADECGNPLARALRALRRKGYREVI